MPVSDTASSTVLSDRERRQMERRRRRQQRHQERSARDRQRLLERNLANQQAAGRALYNRTAGENAANMNRLRGLFGMYGTLSSGVAGATLGSAEAENAARLGEIGTQLAELASRRALEAGQYEGQQALDWARLNATGDEAWLNMLLRAREADEQAALERERLAQQQGQFTEELGFKREEAGAGRGHELELLRRRQEFEGGQAGLGRTHEQEMARLQAELQQQEQERNRAWQSGQTEKAQQHESAMATLQAELQARENERQREFQGGQAGLGREHESALARLQAELQSGQTAQEYALRGQMQQQEQQFTGEQNRQQREAEASRQDAEIAFRIKELSAQMAAREAERGDQRDETQMRFALELAQLAEQIEQHRMSNQIELARLAQSREQVQQGGLEAALSALSRGANLANPAVAQLLAQLTGGAVAGGDGAAAAPTGDATFGVRSLGPGATDQQRQFAEMSDWWARQRGGSAGAGGQPAFFPQGGGYGYDPQLREYEAVTDRMRAISGQRSAISGAGGRPAMADSGRWVDPQRFPAASRSEIQKVNEWAGGGRPPNWSRARLAYWLDAWVRGGGDQATADNLLFNIGG